VYDKEIFNFRISSKYKIGSWLCFENSRGARWHYKDLADAVRAFSNFPYCKLKEIKISVEATDRSAEREDRAQIICLFLKTQDIHRILIDAKGLQTLGFELVDSETGKWFEGERPKSTIKDVPDIREYLPEWDFVLILLSLHAIETYMDKHTQIWGKYPPGLQRWLDRLARRIPRYEGISREGKKAAIEKRRDSCFAHLDLALDGEKGEPANMLRLHRCATWYSQGLGQESEYLRKLERIWSMGFATENNSIAIEKRYFTTHRMNLFFKKKQRSLAKDVPQFRYSLPVLRCDWLCDFRSAIEDAGGWDRDAWFRAYPAGITFWSFKNEKWRLGLFERAGRIYLDESDAFAKRFGGQASRYLAERHGYGSFD
jgi:hypothetical protein